MLGNERKKNWTEVLDIDSVGTFTMGHEALNYIKKGGLGRSSTSGGLILNISATLHYTASWYQIHVAVFKAAIDVVTRNLALEWGTDYDIRLYLCLVALTYKVPPKIVPCSSKVKKGNALPLSASAGTTWIPGVHVDRRRSPEPKEELLNQFSVVPDDLILFAVGHHAEVNKTLDHLRTYVAHELGLIDNASI
ncbi:hypothetical protein FXO38_34370 [Capsicum annuum]|nr:hypothetical protein FXO38_34370 [Capsicum annuum]KAF3644900.1 hypothetical protein FXO37_21242 [Capsicum annuum]